MRQRPALLGIAAEKVNGGRSVSNCTSPDRKADHTVENSNGRNTETGVNISTSEKPSEWTTVAGAIVSNDVNDFKDVIGQSVDMSDEREEALSVMFGFEIFATREKDKTLSEDVQTIDSVSVVDIVNGGVASDVLDGVRSETCGGVTRAAGNAITAICSDMKDTSTYGIVNGSNKENVTAVDNMKKCRENDQNKTYNVSENKKEWITFWCDSESDCAGWLSSLQLSSHAYYNESQNV